jgi:hypothetical protein
MDVPPDDGGNCLAGVYRLLLDAARRSAAMIGEAGDASSPLAVDSAGGS